MTIVDNIVYSNHMDIPNVKIIVHKLSFGNQLQI